MSIASPRSSPRRRAKSRSMSAAAPSSEESARYSVSVSAARAATRHREWRGDRETARRFPPASAPRPRAWPCASRRSSRSASKPVAVVGERAKFWVEPPVLGLARRGHPREIGLHQLGQAAGAAEPPPPAAGQAERPQQRVEEPDIAEADGERPLRDFARAGDRERQRLRIGRHAVGGAEILVAGLQPLRRALVVAAEDEALIGVARRAGVLSRGASGRRGW